MKLELKHLAPYLPYGLKYVNCSSIRMGLGKPLIGDINNMNIMGFIEGDTLSKPTLRPLSDLTKEIEIDGKKIIPSYELGLDKDLIYDVEKFDYFGLADAIEDYLMLLSWHFDVFGLIPQGLAIDINTLK